MNIKLLKSFPLKLFPFNEKETGFVFRRGRQLGKTRIDNFVTRYMRSRLQEILDEKYFSLESKRFSKILANILVRKGFK